MRASRVFFRGENRKLHHAMRGPSWCPEVAAGLHGPPSFVRRYYVWANYDRLLTYSRRGQAAHWHRRR